MLEALRSPQTQQAQVKLVVKEIKTSDLKAGMILDNDLTRADGKLLLSKGQPVSELAAANLRRLANIGMLPERVAVRSVDDAAK